jgi:hypothetical protein
MAETMKGQFREHHKLSEEEYKALWQEAVFVFDTNVLLNIYRYADSTREDLFRVLEALGERIWVPHHVAKEFYANRIKIILEQRSKYEHLTQRLDSALDALRDGSLKKSAFLRLEDIEKIIGPAVEQAKQQIELQRKEHPDLLKHDPYLEKLVSVIGSKIGKEYSTEDLVKTYAEGKQRYAEERPPGYRDLKQKKEPDCYGDLVIWFQILDFAEQSNKPIIFVTDDEKEDWWHKVQGERLGARQELRREMRQRAHVEFQLKQSATFLEEISELLKLNIADSSVSDAKDVARENLEPVAYLTDEPKTGNARRLPPTELAMRYVGWEYAVKTWIRLRWGTIEIKPWNRTPIDYFVSTPLELVGISTLFAEPGETVGSIMRHVLQATALAQAELSRKQTSGYSIIVCAEDQSSAKRLGRLLENKLTNTLIPIVEVPTTVIVGAVHSTVDHNEFIQEHEFHIKDGSQNEW